MLQISNLNDVKAEWNLNETHIIIPMVEGDVIQNKDGEKIAKNTITLNALDGTDQTILTNAVEHTLVIGLERNIFENYNHKNDLVFIQNSDLKKILPLNSEPKNAITYTVSYGEPSKNEVSWDNSLLRERSKSDWCFNQNEKHVFEVRDVLNYSEATQDSSKGWQDCGIEKSNEQIVLEGIDGTAINGDLLSPNPDHVARDENEKETQYIVNYYQTCDTISVLPSTAIINVPNLKGETPNLVQEDKSRNSDELNLLVKSNVDNAFNTSSNIGIHETADNLMAVEADKPAITKKKEMTSILKSNQKVFPHSSVLDIIPDSTNFNTSVINTSDIINIHPQNIAQEISKNTKDENSLGENGSSLPEKSLPLKKKAKMKRTLTNASNFLPGDSNLNHLKKDLASTSVNQGKIAASDNKGSDSDSDVPLVMHMNKNRENYNFKKKRKSKVGSSVKRNLSRTSKKFKMNENSDKESLQIKTRSSTNETRESNDTSSWNIPDRKKFKTIFEVLEDLKAKKLLTDAIVDILTAGLVEMKADVLSEMKSKCESTSNEYSTELKAFALMVHFKQPVAFRRLKEIFGNGWPSFDIIKDWKRRLNNHRKPPTKKPEDDEKEEDT